MLCAPLREVLRRPPELPPPPEPFVIRAVDIRLPERVQPLQWSPTRLAINDQLWGPGFIFPGGETETVHLAKPIGISSAGSLLLVGVGGGGPAGAVVHNLGAWVTGRECEPELLKAAQSRVAGDRLGRRVTLSLWDPENPAFADRRYNHCLALDPLRRGWAEPILHALAQAVRPGGHLVISGTAAETPLDADDPAIARWAALDDRNPRFVPTAKGVTRMLGRLGFDVRIVEDVSRRHIEQALIGWRVLMARLRQEAPEQSFAAHVVKEAELWTLRRRLMRAGRIRMMRWHAISRPLSWAT